MVNKIIWHKAALKDFLEIVEYFEGEGWIQAALNFRKRVDEKTNSLVKFPTSGRPTNNHKNVRYILVDKHRRLYYRLNGKTLTLLAFFDSRQDPTKAPFD